MEKNLFKIFKNIFIDVKTSLENKFDIKQIKIRCFMPIILEKNLECEFQKEILILDVVIYKYIESYTGIRFTCPLNHPIQTRIFIIPKTIKKIIISF